MTTQSGLVFARIYVCTIISHWLPPAAISSARVLALYIATPRQWAAHNVSPRQAELINTQLNALQNALAEKVFLYCSVKWMTLPPASK